MSALKVPLGLSVQEAVEVCEDAEDVLELRELHGRVWQTRTHAVLWDEARELRLARMEASK